MNQIQPHTDHGTFASNKGNDTYVSSENVSHNGGVGDGIGNPVLEHDAQTKGKWFQFLKTKQFFIILVLGQSKFFFRAGFLKSFVIANFLRKVLSLCDVGTNTLTTLLNNEGTSIPAFQSLFNYILLTLIYTTYTIYTYGFKKWLRLIVVDGWRYFILAFFDVEGNYFTVLAYRYVRPNHTVS